MATLKSDQTLESNRNLSRDVLTNTVATTGQRAWRNHQAGLYSARGERKYVNREERCRVLAAINGFKTERALFCLLLAFTGARASELLALTPASFAIESSVISFITLKRRQMRVREIPIPPALMASLDRIFGLRLAQRDEHSSQTPLWRFCRQTAWRIVKRAMQIAHVSGRRASPRGLRHSLGVNALQAGVPLHLIQRWLGHSRLSTTAIYANVVGPEELSFAARFWQASSPALEHHAA
jgi:site-specific recombinase XerD